MSLQSDLANAHQTDRIRLAHTVSNRVNALWSRMELSDLNALWDIIAPQMVTHVVNGQVEAATQATRYLNAVDKSYGVESDAQIVPQAFTNVMGDGREIAPALYGAVTSTKKWIGTGMPAQTAFEAGARFLAVLAQAAITDLGRAADMTLSAGRGYTHYIRVVGGSGCSRCAVLAGTYSATDTAFLRHVHCLCTTCPIPGEGKNPPKGFHDTPDKYFESLSKAEQDRIFTKDGAEAIRQGADVAKVVNARRGAYGIGFSGQGNPGALVRGRRLEKVTIGVKADGTPLQVYATREGVYRGDFRKLENLRGVQAIQDGIYRRTTTIRLMPEQIRIMADGNPTRYRELLKRYGYLS